MGLCDEPKQYLLTYQHSGEQNKRPLTYQKAEGGEEHLKQIHGEKGLMIFKAATLYLI